MPSQTTTLRGPARSYAGGERPAEINVSPAERIASIAAGGLLALWALRKPSLARLAGTAVGADLIYRGATGHCHLYGALGLNTAASDLPGSRIPRDAPQVRRSITIGKSPEELYEFWRNSANLARIAAHFADVSPAADGLTHWRLRGPLGGAIEWDSRYTDEQPGRKLAWQSVPGSTLPNHGEITFRPGPDGKGTEVKLHMQFEPPLGNVGTAAVKAFSQLPRGIAGKSLRRFKALVEAGEIPTLEGNVSARGVSDRY